MKIPRGQFHLFLGLPDVESAISKTYHSRRFTILLPQILFFVKLPRKNFCHRKPFLPATFLLHAQSKETDIREEKSTMSVENVKKFFSQFGMETRIRELSESSATVELAAAALGTEGARIAKTLSFIVEGQAILIVCAGDVKIDNAKYRKFFGCKAKMIPFEQVEEYIGHAPGGVCPFAVREGVKTYLDESLRRFRTVFPACGSSNSAIELSIPELERYSACAQWVDVCKGARHTDAGNS